MVTPSKTLPRKPSSSSDFSKIQSKISGYKPGSLVRGLLFGPSRAGKTHFLATAGQDERSAPSLIIDFEEGGVTAEGAPGIDLFRARDWNDYTEIYAYLMSGSSPYRSCAIDSLSESHIYSQLFVVDDEIKRGHSDNPYFVEQRHYGIALIMMRRLLREFKLLPMHTWFTALDKTDKEEGEGLVRKPHLAGALSGETVGLFSVSAFLLKEKKRDEQTRKAYMTRSLILQNHIGIRAGVRTGWGQEIPNTIEDPTMTKLFDVLKVPFPTK